MSICASITRKIIQFVCAATANIMNFDEEMWKEDYEHYYEPPSDQTVISKNDDEHSVCKICTVV